jgi:hypothetical protein
LRFNWFGHQSRFDVPPPAVDLLVLPVTGHLLCSFIMFPPFKMMFVVHFFPGSILTQRVFKLVLMFDFFPENDDSFNILASPAGTTSFYIVNNI